MSATGPRAAAIAVVLLLVQAACSAAPQQSADASAEPSALASPSAAAPSAAAPSDSPEPAPTGSEEAGTCIPDDTPDLSSGWTLLESRDATFGIAYPDDWEELSGMIDFTTSTLIDAGTFAELGLPEDSTIEADFVRGPDALPNLSVFHLGQVDSTTEEIAERAALRYPDLDSVERMVDDATDGCLGGTPAAGVSFEFASEGDTYYQQNLYAVQEGELYAVQWIDQLEPDLTLFDEILSTWGWVDDGGGPTGSGGFAEAHMASEVDQSAERPDPSTYTTTFGSDAPGIYVVYRPEPGSVGTVNLTWLVEGEVQLEGSLDVDEETTWAFGGITPQSGGFTVGDYELILELNGNEETLEFTVEDAS